MKLFGSKRLTEASTGSIKNITSLNEIEGGLKASIDNFKTYVGRIEKLQRIAPAFEKMVDGFIADNPEYATLNGIQWFAEDNPSGIRKDTCPNLSFRLIKPNDKTQIDPKMKDTLKSLFSTFGEVEIFFPSRNQWNITFKIK